MIGRLKIMKHKQEVVGSFNLSRRNQPENDFLYRPFQKIFEKRIREYPSLAPIKTDNKHSLQYKERESSVLRVEQVSKNIGEHGQLQSLVKKFIGQVARWWDTHHSRLQMWTTASNFFV